MKRVLPSLIFIAVLIGGGYYAYQYAPLKAKADYKTQAEKDAYVRFEMEAYDSIIVNYWQDPATYKLEDIFRLALEKVTNKPQTLATTTREAVADMFAKEVALATSTDAKKSLTLNTLMVVLYNLQPIGRNGILSTQQEKDLRQTVSNINPSKDLYQQLGLEKGASVTDVEQAFQAKEKQLKNSTSTEAAAEREKIAYAKKVLTNTDSKQLYDQNQIEPTIFAHKIGNTLYLYIKQIAPTTFYEFAKAIDNASSTPGLNSLILDVRGNVGGALDFAQNFFGLFMGQNQYAFDLFHQGKYEAQRTVQPKFDQLNRYSDIAILTDAMSQSTAEVMSATFKRLHMGKTVGTHTRGWGTVENTYPLATEIDPNTKYTLLLVNSITLRDDNQPIEGRGVDPDVSIEDKNWQAKLSDHFRSTSLISALKQVAGKAPLK